MWSFFFENLDTSHLSPIDGFWHIRFYVGATWFFFVFRAEPPTPGTGVSTCGADQVYGVQVSSGGCRGEYDMAETLQMGVTTSVHPWQPLSLIQDGADRVSPAQGSCLTSVDKKDKHVCSLLVQNSLLQFNTIFPCLAQFFCSTSGRRYAVVVAMVTLTLQRWGSIKLDLLPLAPYPLPPLLDSM